MEYKDGRCIPTCAVNTQIKYRYTSKELIIMKLHTHKLRLSWSYLGAFHLGRKRRFNESCFGSFHILIYMGGEKMCKYLEVTTIVKRHYISFVLNLLLHANEF